MFNYEIIRRLFFGFNKYFENPTAYEDRTGSDGLASV